MSESPQRAVRVAIFKGILLCFDYKVLPEQVLQPGCRVVVPLRGSNRIGIVIAEVESELAPDALLPISEVLDSTPIISERLMMLLLWIADYYHCPMCNVLRAALPVQIREGKPPKISSYTVWQYCPGDETQISPRATKRKMLYEVLKHEGPLDDSALDSRFVQWKPAMKKLQEMGLVEAQKIMKGRTQSQETVTYQLNDEQTKAIAAVRENLKQFGCYLLEGVTGSGKTEVYLNLCADVVKAKRQVLVLVPEISLIMQTAASFHRRLGKGVLSFHSSLTPTERLHCWSAVVKGSVDVVVGTRSAVFLPFTNLGLIVVDEEHDNSYKDEAVVRYHARDVAIKRAQGLNIPVVLGSATPSMESLYNASRSGKYHHLILTKRISKASGFSQCIIDMRGQSIKSGLSQTLLAAIDDRMQKGEQVLLFINRRGFAPVVMCTSCGAALGCTRCDSYLVYHAYDGKLRCHHCGKVEPTLLACPRCQEKSLCPTGVGIEQVAMSLEELYPDAGLVRFDRDVVRHREQLEQSLDKASCGDAKILVGTQMLIKGHHFPNVTLVGIINVDNGLFANDFRGVERLGQMIVQVSGRAGRGDVAGQVMIQTYHPDHPQLDLLLKGRYNEWAQQLLAERVHTALPPYYRFAVFRAEDKREGEAMSFLRRIVAISSEIEKEESVTMYNPMPAIMEKREGFYRGRLLVRAKDSRTLQGFLRRLLDALTPARIGRKVRWHLDIDPVEVD